MSIDRSLFIVENAKSAEVIRTSDGLTLALISPVPYSREPFFALHPTHPYVAIHSHFEPGLEIRDWQTGETFIRYRLEGDTLATFTGAAWSNDGRRLALMTGDGAALVWFRFDPITKTLTKERLQRPAPNQVGGPYIRFNASGDGLLVFGWNNSLGLVDANSGLPIFSSGAAISTIANMPKSDPQGTLVGLFTEPGDPHRIGMMSLAKGRERTFLNSEQEKGGTFAESDPSGRIVAFALGEKLSVVDVATKKLLLTKRWPGLTITSLFFDDYHLYINSSEARFRLPYKLSGEGDAVLTLGVPERLHIPASNISGLAASRNGKTIASGCYDGYTTTQYAGCWAKLENEPAARKIEDRLSGFGASVSCDGKLVGFGTKSASMIYLQDEGKFDQVKWFSKSSDIAFSDERKWVWVADGILRTDDWSLEPRKWEGSLFDVSRDGKQVLSDNHKGLSCLTDAHSGEVFARVEGHHAHFLADASKIVTKVDGRNAIDDLKLIRRGVLDLGIPWTGPDFANCVEPEPVTAAKFVDEMVDVDNVAELFRVMDQHCEEQARLHPEDGHLAFSAAMLSIDRRNWPEALERLDRSCQLLPEAITPRLWRAYLLAEMRRWPEAIADADWVLERITDTRFRLLRAEWLFRNRDFTRSIKECNAIIQKTQGFETLAHGLRSFNFMELGNNTQALEDRDYLFKNTGDDPKGLSNSAYYMVGSDISLRHPTLAKLYLQKLESQQTDFEPNVRDTIGMVYFRNDEYVRAIDYLSPNLADRTDELYGYAVSVIAMCEAKLGDRESAEQHMKDLETWQPPAGMQFNSEHEIQQLKSEAQIALSAHDDSEQ